MGGPPRGIPPAAVCTSICAATTRHPQGLCPAPADWELSEGRPTYSSQHSALLRAETAHVVQGRRGKERLPRQLLHFPAACRGGHRSVPSAHIARGWLTLASHAGPVQPIWYWAKEHREWASCSQSLCLHLCSQPQNTVGRGAVTGNRGIYSRTDCVQVEGNGVREGGGSQWSLPRHSKTPRYSINAGKGHEGAVPAGSQHAGTAQGRHGSPQRTSPRLRGGTELSYAVSKSSGPDGLGPTRTTGRWKAWEGRHFQVGRAGGFWEMLGM